MKKILAILLAAVCIFSFAACDVSIDAQEGHISESVDLSEALEYISTIEPEPISVRDTGLLAVARDGSTGLFGFVNILGEWVIPARYAAAVGFKGDYGLILNSYSGYEYINRDGAKIYTSYASNQIAESNHFSEGLLVLAVANDSLQKYVYLNENFKTVISAGSFPAVDWRNYASDHYFGLATPFNGGYAVVMKQKNTDCHDWLDWESAYVIDNKGKIVATLPSGLDADASGVDENGNIIMKTTTNLHGLYTKDGSMLIDCKYRFLKHCEGPLYLACNEKGFWGYIDQNDNLVIPFQYQKALPFSEGLAAVYDGRYWGFIDENGDLAIESVFDDVAALKSSNQDVSGSKGAFCEGRAAVKKDGYWIIIDQNEYPYICFTEDKCQGIDGCPFTGISNGYVCCKQNVEGKVLYGVMTSNGKKVLEPQFEYLDLFY